MHFRRLFGRGELSTTTPTPRQHPRAEPMPRMRTTVNTLPDAARHELAERKLSALIGQHTTACGREMVNSLRPMPRKFRHRKDLQGQLKFAMKYGHWPSGSELHNSDFFA